MIRDQRVRVFWTYTNRFTEANAGGGTNTVKITPAANTAIKLLALTVEMCNSAAGRATAVALYDEDGAFNLPLLSASLDTAALSIPAIGANAITASNMANSQNVIVVGDGSYLGVVGTSLANTEYFDVRCCFELFGTTTAPTVTHTSTGTASTGTASQNEVTVVPVMA